MPSEWAAITRRGGEQTTGRDPAWARCPAGGRRRRWRGGEWDAGDRSNPSEVDSTAGEREQATRQPPQILESPDAMCIRCRLTCARLLLLVASAAEPNRAGVTSRERPRRHMGPAKVRHHTSRTTDNNRWESSPSRVGPTSLASCFAFSDSLGSFLFSSPFSCGSRVQASECRRAGDHHPGGEAKGGADRPTGVHQNLAPGSSSHAGRCCCCCRRLSVASWT